MVKAIDICLPSDDNEYEELVEFADAMANITTNEAVIVPDNATNGDMIKAMFPKAKEWEVTEYKDVAGHYVDFGEGTIKKFALDWWNAPYKAESEGEGMPNSLKCKIKHLCHNGTINERERDRILKALEQEPKTGHWIMTNDYFTGAYEVIDYVRCSCCGEDSLEEGDYCPNCGAKMESEG